VGRVANRIGKGTFSIGGQEYNVTLNRGTYHLHGGTTGFDKVSLVVLVTILFFDFRPQKSASHTVLCLISLKEKKAQRPVMLSICFMPRKF
jgi:hypothetical protein